MKKMKKIAAVIGTVVIMISGGARPLDLYASEAAAVPAPSGQEMAIDYTTYVDQVASLAETEDQKRYRSLCPAFEAGETITLKSSEDREAFVRYYRNSYDLFLANTQGTVWYEGDRNTYLETPVSDYRAAVITATINKFGLSVDADPLTAIRNTCSRVRSGFQYDYDYMKMTYPDALVSGHAICVHYSMAAYILLNAEGIPTRMVAGTRSGGGHQWNECFVNGAWVTVDFTSFADKNISPDGFVSADYLGTYVEV